MNAEHSPASHACLAPLSIYCSIRGKGSVLRTISHQL